MAKMTIIPAREAKNRFGEMLEAVQRQPVTITKNGRPIARLTSIGQARFEEVEDQLWLERAEKVDAKANYISPAESLRFLKSLGHGTRTRKTRTKISR